MCKAYRFWSWGLVLVLLIALLFPLAAVRAEGTTDENGITMSITQRPFTEIVQMLARGSGMNLVILDTVDTVINRVDINAPAKNIIASLATTVGLAFWQDGDTYYIGKPRTTEPVSRAVKPAEVEATPTASLVDDPGKLPKLSSPVGGTPRNPGGFSEVRPEPQPAEQKMLIKRVDLRYFSAVELLWALGKPGAALGSRQAEKRVRDRISSLHSPKKSFDINASNAAGPSSPWVNAAVSSAINRTGATNADQIRNPRNMTPGMGAGAITPAGVTATGTDAAGASSLGQGELTPFIPKGIKDIVGLVGLNALLVRAENEDDIDQLEMLIKLLDQPVKQVIVECMIVKMSVQDAFTMGVSWSYAGMPISVISNNGGNQGNFAVSYVKGSVKVALATSLSNSDNKVVQNPRVIVPNGGGGSISIEEEVPFIITSSESDVFGRTIESAEIGSEFFEQGLDVYSVMIHPDDTITLNVAPIIDIPTVSIPIPGGAGALLGHQEFILESLVTVKNGETILLGGFSNKTEAKAGTRAPLLGNLPVIGPLLFRNKSHGTNNSETLVFVTATIMKADDPIFGEMAPLPPLF
ncbi:MAG: type II secretion system protein GspD [Armatimonadota bacterium]